MIFDPNYKEVDIKGYEGLYKISNKGDVISLSKIRGFLKLKERIITPTIKWKKYIEASYKYRTNTDKMTASDYTHLFGYLNPYYRSAYNVSKRRK